MITVSREYMGMESCLHYEYSEMRQLTFSSDQFVLQNCVIFSFYKNVCQSTRPRK